MELSETESSLKEIEQAGEEVFKIIGQLMIKTDKSKIKKELLNKQKIIDIRMKTLEKQESSLSEKVKEIREEIMKTVDKKQK